MRSLIWNVQGRSVLKKNTESNQGSKGSKEIEEKKKELEQAEKDEDFEKASKLRDEIISLQKKH